jgi:hypothetical protein
MKQPISRKQHAIADFSYIPAVASLPSLAGFEDEKKAVAVARALSASAAVSAFFTRAEWGVVKVVPFKTHLILDVALSVFAFSSPWIFGFSKNDKARNAMVATGLVGLMASTLSRPEEMPANKKML